MLDKNVFVRDTLRLVTSEIKRFEVDTRQEPSDDEIISILKRMAKPVSYTHLTLPTMLMV